MPKCKLTLKVEETSEGKQVSCTISEVGFWTPTSFESKVSQQLTEVTAVNTCSEVADFLERIDIRSETTPSFK